MHNPSIYHIVHKIIALSQEMANLCKDYNLHNEHWNNQTLDSSQQYTKSRKKLLHIASDSFQGGAESVFRNTIELSIKSNQFSVYTASCEDNILHSLKHIKLDDYHHYSKYRGILKYIYNTKNYHILLNALNTIQPDIIHTQNYLSRLSPSVLFALKKYKKNYPNTLLVFTEHRFSSCANHCFYNFWKQQICESCIHSTKLQILWKNCDKRGFLYSMIKAIRTLFYQGIFLKEQDLFDKIIFVSRFQMHKHLADGYNKAKITMITNPIDFRFLNPQISLKDKQNIIVFYGRISAEKNVPLLIKSFAALIKNDTFKDYKLLIIGNGDDKTISQHLAYSLLPYQSYEFINHLTPENIKGILYRAKITVLPSKLYETFGLVLVESILSGAIPIASNIGALQETIHDYFGFCFEMIDDKQNANLALESTMREILFHYEQIFKIFTEKRKEIIRDLKQNPYWNALENLYVRERGGDRVAFIYCNAIDSTASLQYHFLQFKSPINALKATNAA